MSSLKMTKIPNLNVLVIKQGIGNEHFVASPNSIVITIDNLSLILRMLINSKCLDHEVLEGILEEYHTDSGRKNAI